MISRRGKLPLLSVWYIPRKSSIKMTESKSSLPARICSSSGRMGEKPGMPPVPSPEECASSQYNLFPREFLNHSNKLGSGISQIEVHARRIR